MIKMQNSNELQKNNSMKEFCGFLQKSFFLYFFETLFKKILSTTFIILFLCASWFLCAWIIYNYGFPIKDYWYSFPSTLCSTLFLGGLPLFVSLGLIFRMWDIE